MTTIAYDGKTLATDSRVTDGNFVFGEGQKLFKLKDGAHIALCGAFCLYPAVVAWLNGEGDEPELRENESIGGLLVGPQGAFELAKTMRLYPACVPWAGGSGTAVALTAMKCGKTAEEAIVLACELDIYTGGPVQKVSIRGSR